MVDTNMELKDLRCFLTVARELNFNRAAEQLNMSQPPLTKIIAQLEHELGVKLFSRTTRRVDLTSAGLQLLQEAQSLIDQIDTSARKIRHTITDRKQHFVIGCTTLALFSFLPNVLKRFRESCPEVKLDIEELPSKTIISKLVSAEIDVGFPYMPVSHSLLETKSIWREQMKLAVPHFYPYTNQDVVPLNVFAKETFIMHSRYEHSAMYEEIIQCCKQAGFKPLLKESPKPNCIGLVTAGIGVHFVSSRIKSLTLNGLTCIDTDPSPSLEMAVAWRKEDKCDHLTLFKTLAFEEDS
jgi:DNA-binding transcriptional LysR family regulator